MSSTPIVSDNILLDMKILAAFVRLYATNKRARNILLNTSKAFLILHGHQIQSDLIIQTLNTGLISANFKLITVLQFVVKYAVKPKQQMSETLNEISRLNYGKSRVHLQ